MISKLVTFSMTSLLCTVLIGLPALHRSAASPSRTTTADWPIFDEASMSALTPQAQEDKPVEQTRKNIQVLKGLPESQLFPLMNVMATSIGVRCDYCHVNKGKYYNGNWVWESDEKPKKLVGRRMIKMVLDINRTNFDADTSVTCYTCHRGSTVLARLPPLPPHDPNPTNAVLPTSEQILAKYVAAVGGKDDAAKFKTTVMKGTLEFDIDSQKRNGQVEVMLKAPDKYLIARTLPDGATTAVVNGPAGWVRNSTGLRKLSGGTLEPLRQSAAIYGVIKIRALPAEMKVLGTEKIGDREAYVVALIVDPNTTRRFFFDTQTGLLVRELTTTRTMLAPLPSQVDYEDYRDVDGIQLPFTIRTSDAAPYSTTTRRFKEIKHNVAVSDDVFNVPTTPL